MKSGYIKYLLAVFTAVILMFGGILTIDTAAAAATDPLSEFLSSPVSTEAIEVYDGTDNTKLLQ